MRTQMVPQVQETGPRRWGRVLIPQVQDMGPQRGIDTPDSGDRPTAGRGADTPGSGDRPTVWGE